MEDRCPEGAIFAHQWIIKAIFFLKQRKIILIFFSLASKTFNQYSLDNLHIFSNYSIIFEHFKRVHSSTIDFMQCCVPAVAPVCKAPIPQLCFKRMNMKQAAEGQRRANTSKLPLDWI